MVRKGQFGWALAPLMMSGAAALGLQVLWTRRVMDLVGANVESSARVFGCFFLGFALGAAVAALRLPGIRRPWRSTACVELAVLVLSVPALLLSFWTGPIWPALGPEKICGWQGAWLRFALSLTVVLPAAFFMGMTLPLATAAVCNSGRALSRHGVWVYAAYTLGGGLGLVVVAGWTLPLLGVTGSMLFLGGINLLASVLFLQLDYGWTEYTPQCVVESREPGVEVALTRRLTLILSFCSGAGVIALEILGLQLLNLKTPVAFYPQAAILFCAVFLLALAAAVVPWAFKRVADTRCTLLFALAGTGVATAASPLLFMAATGQTTGLLGHGRAFGAFLLTLEGAALIALGPAVFLAGLVFPLLMADTQCSSASAAGRRLGTLLAINGLGGVVGAEMAYRLLLPVFHVHLALGLVGICYGLIAVAVRLTPTRRALMPLGIAFASIGVTALLLGTALKKLPVFLREATFAVLQVRSGREGTLAVVERDDLGRAMFLDNHYMLGCTKAGPDMERQAHLPILLHPDPKRVCFIGLGTGITASGALKHEAIQSITIYELSQLVADAAMRDFMAYNQGICSNPKVTLEVQDAGPQLAAAKDAFDVIIGDLFTPWRPGEARLCSLEQFEAARNALRAGGVFCQWLPMTQLTQEQFDLIAATFQRVFGEVHFFRNNFHGRSLPVALVGFKEGKLDWGTAARRCVIEREAGHLRDPLCRHAEGLALIYLGTYQQSEPADVGLNTLENMRVEFAASRRLLAGGPGEYFTPASELWLTFVRRQLETLRSDNKTPEWVRALPEVGALLSRWELAAEGHEPGAVALEQQVLRKLPVLLLSDSQADWSLWPARKPKSPESVNEPGILPGSSDSVDQR